MRIEILGCSGGFGPDLRTTSLLIDDQTLLDAGTGVGDLSLAQMARINHVFLTHSHLDHVCGLAFIADNLADMPRSPMQVHGIAATLEALRRHLFNWILWPDFTELPNKQNPVLEFNEVVAGVSIEVSAALKFTAFPVMHVVPAVGYCLTGDNGVFAFTGDTTASESLWQHLNALPRLDVLMIEVAFPDEQAELAAIACHFTPALLGKQLQQLRHQPQLLLTHHKPGLEERIRQQCVPALQGRDYRHLQRGDVLTV